MLFFFQAKIVMKKVENGIFSYTMGLGKSPNIKLAVISRIGGDSGE